MDRQFLWLPACAQLFLELTVSQSQFLSSKTLFAVHSRHPLLLPMSWVNGENDFGSEKQSNFQPFWSHHSTVACLPAKTDGTSLGTEDWKGVRWTVPRSPDTQHASLRHLSSYRASPAPSFWWRVHLCVAQAFASSDLDGGRDSTSIRWPHGTNWTPENLNDRPVATGG